MKKIINIALLLCLIVNLNAQSTLFFTGSVSSVWGTTGNWSLTSGGASSGTIPNSNTHVIFDNNSPKCNIMSNLAANKVTIQSNFADSIIVKDSITVTFSDTIFQHAGVFNAKSANLVIVKGLMQSSGTFYASSALSTIGGFLSIAGNFMHNNGKVLIDRTTQFYTNAIFNNLDYGSSASTVFGISQGKIVTIEKDFKLLAVSSSGIKTINGPGKIHLKGDLYQSPTNGTAEYAGDIVITMNGTNNQSVFGNNNQVATRCHLPEVEINKPSGTLYLKGIISTYGGFDLISGNFDASTFNSTVQIVGSQTNIYPITYNYLNILSMNSSTAFNVNSGADITVLKDLKLLLQNTQNSRAINGPGRIKIQGDLYQAIPNGTSNFTGNMVFCMIGQDTQSIVGNNDLTATTAYLHKIEVNKSSGILFIKNALTSSGGFDLQAGTINATAYNSTVQLVSSTIFTNNFSFNHLIIFPRTASSISISVNQGKKVIVLGNLSYNVLSTSTASYSNVNGPGQFELHGNLTAVQNGISVNAGGGNALIKLVGAGNQTISGNNTEGLGRFPSILIDKVSGLVFLEKKISVGGDFEIADDSGSVADSSCLIMYSANSKLKSGPNVELYALKLKNDPVTLTGEVKIKNEINLGTYDLELSNYNLIINNPATSAISYTTGGLIMDAPQFSSAIKWKSSNVQNDSYTIPLQSATSYALPFNYVISNVGTTGNSNAIYNVLSTYATGADNFPYPPSIDSLLDSNGNNNVLYVADRFYRLNMEGFDISPVYDIKCRYQNSEFASPNIITEANMKAQLFNGMELGQPKGTVNTTLNEIAISGFDRFGNVVIFINGSKPSKLPARNSTIFAELKKQLDGGFNTMVGNVNFIYKEKYNANNLNYKIYNWKRELVLCSETACTPLITSSAINKNGVNYHSLNVNSVLINNEYYTIEVTNEKGEVYLMRFLFKTSS